MGKDPSRFKNEPAAILVTEPFKKPSFKEGFFYCFFVTSERPLRTTFSEIFQFLSLVCDRSMPLENIAAKKQFKPNAKKKEAL